MTVRKRVGVTAVVCLFWTNAALASAPYFMLRASSGLTTKEHLEYYTLQS
jgi:hypothetical protein